MPTPTTLPNSFTAGDVLTAANMNNLRGAFRILQVSQAVKTDTETFATTTFTDITGLSVTITPYSNTSKFFLFTQVSLGGSRGELQFTGGNSGNYVGDAAGNRIRVGVQVYNGISTGMTTGSMAYLDSPATASAITYKVQFRAMSAAVNTYINRSGDDTDTTSFARAASMLLVCEVSA